MDCCCKCSKFRTTDNRCQFITLSVHLGVQCDAFGEERRTGQSAAAETCSSVIIPVSNLAHVESRSRRMNLTHGRREFGSEDNGDRGRGGTCIQKETEKLAPMLAACVDSI